VLFPYVFEHRHNLANNTGWGSKIDHVYEELHSAAEKKKLFGGAFPLCLCFCSYKHGDVAHGAIFMYVQMEGTKFCNTNV
jgi:hypothetical protein